MKFKVLGSFVPDPTRGAYSTTPDLLAGGEAASSPLPRMCGTLCELEMDLLNSWSSAVSHSIVLQTSADLAYNDCTVLHNQTLNYRC